MNTPAGERLHALDNLRAVVMWLGIVLHVAVIYIAGPSPLPWRDNQTTPTADLLMAFIHAFRMPVFFILAGFFVALLIERRGAVRVIETDAVAVPVAFGVIDRIVALPRGFAQSSDSLSRELALAHELDRAAGGGGDAIGQAAPG